VQVRIALSFPIPQILGFDRLKLPLSKRCDILRLSILARCALYMLEKALYKMISEAARRFGGGVFGSSYNQLEMNALIVY